MRRVLLTGMSGSGTSSVVRALVERGYRAVDADDGWCEPTGDGRQRWRLDAVNRLLDTEDADVLFFGGCEENMVALMPRFDTVILLAAPVEVLLERVCRRTDNPYGSSAADRERIRLDTLSVEPRLRRVADHVVDTLASLDDVVGAILRLAGVD